MYSSRSQGGKDPRALICYPRTAGVSAPRSFGSKVQRDQRFVGQRFVALRSRKYLSRYDLGLLFNGFAYCLIISLYEEGGKC
jgi:hypothetical protein